MSGGFSHQTKLSNGSLARLSQKATFRFLSQVVERLLAKDDKHVEPDEEGSQG